MSMEQTKVTKYIEAILFHKAGPVKRSELKKILSIESDVLDLALIDLEKQLEGRGLQLMIKDSSVMLGTHPEVADIIESLVKNELDKTLSKVALETLSIVLYRTPISRAEIDYIRGVNSSFILRNLLIRGLVERIAVTGKRGNVYRPTFELMSYLGVTRLEDLPDYEKMRNEIEERTNIEDENDGE